MKSHRAMSRPCPVPLCGNAARSGHLMCRGCWGNVPADAQRAVNRSWSAVRAAMQGKTPELRERVGIYRKASDAAIAAVERSRP